VKGLGLCLLDMGFGISEVRGVGFRVWGSGFGVWESKYQGSGVSGFHSFRVEGLGFRV